MHDLVPSATGRLPADPGETALLQIEAILESSIGLAAGILGRSTLARAIGRVMEVDTIASTPSLVRKLQVDNRVLEQLIEEVVVPESWFFRDKAVFDRIIPWLRDRSGRRDRPVRILSMPCAAGEEPYSLAMGLLDAGVSRHSFEILAADVSRRAIRRAADGRFRANAFRNADLGFRDRWFRREGYAWVIDESIRSAVHVEQGNLLAPRPQGAIQLDPPGRYDLILCRHLLIYLGDKGRRTAEDRLRRLLAVDGMLVIGAAEPSILQGRWQTAFDGLTSCLLQQAPEQEGQEHLVSLTASQHSAHRARRADPLPHGGSAPPAWMPCPPASPSLQQTPGDAAPRMATADPGMPGELRSEVDSLANAGRFDEAIAGCERWLQSHEPTADLYFLIGILHQAAERVGAAEDALQRAVYLDPHHEDALLALAMLAGRRGDSDLERRYRRSAARAAAAPAAPAAASSPHRR